MKTKTTTLYICEICNTEFENQSMAEKCEESGMPPDLPVKVGDTIALKNRSSKLYTSAVLVGMRVGLQFSVGGKHDWLLKLKEEVYLDHKWEERTDEVADLYLLTPEEAAQRTRKDNYPY